MTPFKSLFAGLVYFLPFTVLAQCEKLSVKADKEYVCGSGIVRFELSGAKNAKVIEWDFGHGFRQGSDTLLEFLVRQGTVDVTVRVTWEDNSVCSANFRSVTLVRTIPQATFSVSRDKLCDGPDTVSFFCNDQNVENVSWIIDGTNYFNQGRKVNHRFTGTGEKGLTLIVHDSFGCRGISQVKKAIEVYPDVVMDILSDKVNGCVPQQLSIKSKLNTGGQKIVAWRWTLPGISATELYSEHINSLNINAAGDYDVSLEVQTENGCLHKLTKPKLIQMGDSVPVHPGFIKPMFCSNETIVLSDAFQKTGGTYTWNLPPKATDVKADAPFTRSFRLADPGIYSFTVKYERNGCATSKTVDSALVVHRVKADFKSANNFHCTPPLSVQLANTTSTSDSGSLSYFWKVKDDIRVLRMSSDKDLSINFSEWGYYDIELMVIHSNGCRDTMRRNNFVRIDTIRSEFVVEPAIACRNQIVRFKNNTLPSTYIGSDTFYWVFYDKNGKDILGTSRLRNPEFSYADTGIYPVALFAGNASGCNNSLVSKKVVEIIRPVLKPIIPLSEVCSGNSIRLQQYTQPSHANFTHYWYIHEVGGNTTWAFRSKDTSVRIQNVGSYDVIYAVQIADGCRDSVILPAAFSVNGVAAKVTVDGISGCVPYKVESEAVILKNQHIGSESSQLKYSWTMQPAQYVKTSQHKPEKFSAEFNQKGIYEFSLEIENSAGCKSRIKSEKIYVGVDAKGNISDKRVCVGSAIDLTSTSQLLATSFEWSSPDTGLIFSQHSSAKSRLIPNREGVYTLRLIAGKNSKCFDTAYFNFEAIKVKAEFYSPDTLLSCAPVYAKFISTSKNADDLVWDFGDEGESFITKIPNGGHVYFKNSGGDRGFDVRLIARNNEGCSDTLTKKSYLWVKGPVPRILMKNLKGCEPLEVMMENKSTDAVLIVTDYANGFSMDSAGIKSSYTFKVENDLLDTQYFKPKFFVYDSLGCVASFEPDTHIMVKRAPYIQWNNSPNFGCEPFDYNYSDQTLNVVKRAWEIETSQDVVTDSLRSGKMLFSENGSYQLKLKVTNGFECSAEKKESILVHSTPKASILFQDTICFQQSYLFENSSNIVLGHIADHHWILKDDTSTIDASEESRWEKYFDKNGDFDLWYKVKSDKGCTDSMRMKLHVPHPDEIPVPAVQMATVNDGAKVDLSILPINYYRAEALSISHNGHHLFFEEAPQKNHLRHLPIDGISHDQCYEVSLLDICGYQGQKSSPHCVIRLSTESRTLFTAHLTWTPYVGWKEISSYQVYRQEEGQAEILVAELPADRNEFVDSHLCNRKYVYRVAAINGDRSLKTYSNRSDIQPLYKVSDVRLNVRGIQVAEDNSKLVIHWDATSSERFASYSLSKSIIREDGSLLPLGLYPVSENKYTDTEVQPEYERYVYSVAETDICGNDNQSGMEGVSILLGGKYEDYKAFLDWTPGGLNSTDVKNYEIQVRYPQRGFIEVEKIYDQSLSFVDARIHTGIQEDYCYRIMAVSNGLTPDTSISNVVCLNGKSQIHVPNAFTPNGDGKNDVFRPVSIFGYNQSENTFKMYHFEIFNRWGEQIYQTNRLEEGWDGTYLGENMESGMFMYQIRFFGLDHKIHMKEGSVLLIR